MSPVWSCLRNYEFVITVLIVSIQNIKPRLGEGSGSFSSINLISMQLEMM